MTGSKMPEQLMKIERVSFYIFLSLYLLLSSITSNAMPINLLTFLNLYVCVCIFVCVCVLYLTEGRHPRRRHH